MKQDRLYITICPEDDMFERLDVSQGDKDGFYDAKVFTLLDESLPSIVSDPNNIESIIDNMKFNLQYEEFADSFPFSKYVIEHCKDKDFFTSASTIYINGVYEDIAEYLRRNPELLSKEIVLEEFLSLDKNTCLRLKEVFKEFPNIKLRVEGNKDLVSITDYEKTIDAIDAIVDKIKRYNYSPLEQLILAYDLIRDRFYVKEDEGENYNISRDLTTSLLGDKIVCVGFANIFDTVCKKLGLKSNIFLLENRKDPSTSGHARNMIYLQDEKYEIDGIYFFDPTFDCKKDNNNNFLFSYRFFAKDYKEMDELSGYNYIPMDFKLFDDEYFCALMDKCEELTDDKILILRFLASSKINYLLRFIGRDTFEPMSADFDPVELVDACYAVKSLAENSIGAEKFLKALYTVRKNQYYEEPRKYMFDVQTLTKIITNSKFRADDSAELSLLAAMGFVHYYGKESGEAKVKRFITENNLDTDIERTKLARTLRTILQTRLEEESKGKKM